MDNGSTDGSAEYVQRVFPSVRVVHLPDNQGIPAALNAGIAQARGAFIGLINNDTEADAAWLAESIQALETHPAAGSTATRMRLFYRRTHLDTAGDLYFRSGYPAKRGWLAEDGPEYARPAWVFGTCGGAAVYRRCLFEDVGVFDEDFGAGLEDFDLSFRAQLMGYRCVYVPSAVVYHKVGATVGVGLTSAAQQYRFHRNRLYVLIKNLPAALWSRYAAAMVAAEALVFAAAARRRRLGILLRARAEVAGQMPRLLEKRRTIQPRRTVTSATLDAIVERNWIAHRRAEKRREATAPRWSAPAAGLRDTALP